MSAHRASLSPDLEQAMLQGALTFNEAWSIEDQLLLAEQVEVEMPWELEPQLRKLWLYQIPEANSLPL